MKDLTSDITHEEIHDLIHDYVMRHTYTHSYVCKSSQILYIVTDIASGWTVAMIRKNCAPQSIPAV